VNGAASHLDLLPSLKLNVRWIDALVRDAVEPFTMEA
jgi:hypothetical protein